MLVIIQSRAILVDTNPNGSTPELTSVEVGM